MSHPTKKADAVRPRCQVRGQIVEPCTTLDKAIGAQRALRYHELMQVTTGRVTGSFVSLYTGEFVRRGIILNVCPFCATNISEHLDRRQVPA